MYGLWSQCRAPEGGLNLMPDEGGVNDQACFVLSAFSVLEAAHQEYQEWRKEVRKG